MNNGRIDQTRGVAGDFPQSLAKGYVLTHQTEGPSADSQGLSALRATTNTTIRTNS